MSENNKRFVPIDNDTNTKERFAPFSGESTKERFVPSNDKSTKERFVPSSGESTKERFVPSSGESTKERFVPSNDKSTKERFVPEKTSIDKSVEKLKLPVKSEPTAEPKPKPLVKSGPTTELKPKPPVKSRPATEPKPPVKSGPTTEPKPKPPVSGGTQINRGTQVKQEKKKKNKFGKMLLLILVAFLLLKSCGNKDVSVPPEEPKQGVNGGSQTENDNGDNGNTDDGGTDTEVTDGGVTNGNDTNGEVIDGNGTNGNGDINSTPNIMTEEEKQNIEGLMYTSFYAFTEAVNYGDSSLVLPYYTYNGPLYEEQLRMVDYFHNKGIREELEEFYVTDIAKINEEVYTANTKSTINIYKDGIWELRAFDSKYYLKKVNGEFLVDSIIYENEVTVDTLFEN